jgi:hydrogenase nickel incorporation protein HypA/HybF
VHELAITEGVVDAVTGRLPGARVTCVRLEIGALSGVAADSVRFCFDLVTEGTSLAGARLEISQPPGRCSCRACGSEFEPGGPIALCPVRQRRDHRPGRPGTQDHLGSGGLSHVRDMRLLGRSGHPAGGSRPARRRHAAMPAAPAAATATQAVTFTGLTGPSSSSRRCWRRTTGSHSSTGSGWPAGASWR